MNIEQHNFITQYLRHNSAYTAYCIAYNVEDQSQYETIMAAAYKLMDDPEVGGVIRSVLDGVRHDVEQEIRAKQKTELLTVQSKRELLARIARGELTAVQHYKGKDCNHCTQMVLPTINQMLNAIDLDSKLAGHYSVDKRQSTVDNSQLTTDSTEMESNARKDDNLSPSRNLSRYGGRGIGGNPQQLSEAVSLQPLRKPSISQQNATNEQSPIPGRALGETDLQNIENTALLQQNATIHLSPSARDVCRTGEYSGKTENTSETQQNTTNEQSSGYVPH